MDFIIEMKRHNIFSGNQAEQQTEGGYDGGVSVARYHTGEEARHGRCGLPLPGAGRVAGQCACASGLVYLNSCFFFRPKWYTISEFRSNFEIDASEQKFERAIR